MYISRKSILLIAIILIFFISRHLGWIFYIAAAVLLCIGIILAFIDTLFLFKAGNEVKIDRFLPEQLMNGEDNELTATLTSTFPYDIKVSVIDELPQELQVRNFKLSVTLSPNKSETISYRVHPRQRGLLTFGDLHVYVSGKTGMIERHFCHKYQETDPNASTKVYPSYSLIRNMDFLSVANKDRLLGNKSVKRGGQSKNFDKIREYITSDDYRNINWKASARRHTLMVNQYTDEQSLNLYAIIDKGRGMQHAFEGVYYLDYAISSALCLCHVALTHADNAGLITFGPKIDSFIVSDKREKQILRIKEALYNEQSQFVQSDYSAVFNLSRVHIKKRSFFIIYTNFDSMVSLQMQLPYLQKMAQNHLLLVVFFIDKDLEELIAQQPDNTEEFVTQTIGRKFRFEKKQIIRELRRHGIYALLTAPEHLNINVINKYLEFKSRNII